MVNINRLREAMNQKSVSLEDAAKAIGIDRATFYRRIEKAGTKFTVEEVDKLANLLDMDSATMQDIFFDRQLA